MGVLLVGQRPVFLQIALSVEFPSIITYVLVGALMYLRKFENVLIYFTFWSRQYFIPFPVSVGARPNDRHVVLFHTDVI